MSLTLSIQLARRDVSERFSGSILGGTWVFLQPLVMVAIYIVVFSKLMNARIPGVMEGNPHAYGVFLISGVLPWLAMQQTLLRCASIFTDKKSILTKLPMQLPVLPLSVLIVETVVLVVTMAVFVLYFIVFVGWPSVSFFFLLPLLLIQQSIAFGLGLLLAMMNVFLRDLKELTGIFFSLWFWLTPIVYPVVILPEFIQHLMVYNPTYYFAASYQGVFLHGSTPNLVFLSISSVCALLVVGFAMFIHRRLERDVRDFL